MISQTDFLWFHLDGQEKAGEMVCDRLTFPEQVVSGPSRGLCNFLAPKIAGEPYG